MLEVGECRLRAHSVTGPSRVLTHLTCQKGGQVGLEYRLKPMTNLDTHTPLLTLVVSGVHPPHSCSSTFALCLFVTHTHTRTRCAVLYMSYFLAEPPPGPVIKVVTCDLERVVTTHLFTGGVGNCNYLSAWQALFTAPNTHTHTHSQCTTHSFEKIHTVPYI